MTAVELPQVLVERLKDSRVKLTTGGWSDVFEEDRRERWAAWYAKMFKTYGEDRYRQIAEALRALPPVTVH